MRITASWFGPLARRIQGCGTNIRAPRASSPRLRHPDHTKCAVVLGAVKDKPLRVALTRHPLTAPARAGRSFRVGRGEETGCPGRTRKVTLKNIDRPPWGTSLTKSAPYKESSRCCSHIWQREGRPIRWKPRRKSPRWPERSGQIRTGGRANWQAVANV
jgi:hypothetical protein